MASCGITAIVAVLIYVYLLAYVLPASLIQPGQRHRHISAFPVAALLAYLNGVEYMLSHFLVWLDQLPLLPARRFCSLPHCRKGVPKSAKALFQRCLGCFPVRTLLSFTWLCPFLVVKFLRFRGGLLLGNDRICFRIRYQDSGIRESAGLFLCCSCVCTVLVPCMYCVFALSCSFSV